MEEKKMRPGNDFFGLPVPNDMTENVSNDMTKSMSNDMKDNVLSDMKRLPDTNTRGQDWRTGDLPNPAPLAVGFVPWQRDAETRYKPEEALTRGTLFPGLDLPFMNIVNKGVYAGTPMGELMALGFVAHELVLYLDTHKDDREAFAMLQQVLRLKTEAHRRYTERYGPVTTGDLSGETSFTWTRSPWPWEPAERSAN